MGKWDKLYDLQRSGEWKKNLERKIPKVKVVECPHCGEEVPATYTKCRYCGGCVRCNN